MADKPAARLPKYINTLADSIAFAKTKTFESEKYMPEISQMEIEFCILALWTSLPPLRDPFLADQTPGPDQYFDFDHVGVIYLDMEIYCKSTEADIEPNKEPDPYKTSYTPGDLEIIYNVFTEGVCRGKYDAIGSTFSKSWHEASCLPWEAKDNDHTGYIWAIAFAHAALELDDVFVGKDVTSPPQRLVKAMEGVQQRLRRRKLELEWAFQHAKGMALVR